jgi:hypothetical protein
MLPSSRAKTAGNETFRISEYTRKYMMHFLKKCRPVELLFLACIMFSLANRRGCLRETLAHIPVALIFRRVSGAVLCN